jgi:hypothetical protein
MRMRSKYWTSRFDHDFLHSPSQSFIPRALSLRRTSSRERATS